MRKAYMATVVKIMVSIALQIVALSALRHGLYSFGAGLILADILYLYVVMILAVKKVWRNGSAGNAVLNLPGS